MPQSLGAWLTFIQAQHPSEIELGLTRAQKVFNRLFDEPWAIPTVTVAGTNGKGTTVAILEALLEHHDLNVLSFTSPHLFDYRERVKYNRDLLSADFHCQAFEAVHKAADGIELTFFEYSTLAAFWLAHKKSPDVLVLEVGLGGRLDAVNIVAADIVVVTTIDYDHQEYLGDTLEAIATEKLGVVHANTQLILADNTVPEDCLSGISPKRIFRAQEDFVYKDSTWLWTEKRLGPWNLTFAQAPESNPAAAIAAFSMLPNINIETDKVIAAISDVKLLGRFQQIKSMPVVYVDVAHNPQAIVHLLNRQELQIIDNLYVVLGLLADKKITKILELLNKRTQKWYLCDLDTPRSWQVNEIMPLLPKLGISLSDVTCYASVLEAYSQALMDAERTGATILVLGSFHAVGPVLEQVSSDVE